MDQDEVMNIVGTIGGFAISLSLVPQVYLTYKTKCADDTSYLYQGIYIVGTALVNVYAIHFGLYAVYVPCLLELSLIVCLTIMKCIYPTRLDLKEDLKVIASRHSLVSLNTDGSRALNMSRHKSIRILKTMSLSGDIIESKPNGNGNEAVVDGNHIQEQLDNTTSCRTTDIETEGKATGHASDHD